ncbi:NUMOD1 domain-containing DNA-binding protein [Niallia alba]|uniref:NUMOD1 domain-containing DNA-binding protein n=1 Tax=Niallia alba TaxID=2729105 RepID=UPI00399CAD75
MDNDNKPTFISSSKEVIQLSLNNEFIGYFKSISEASRSTKININNIIRVCNKKQKSTRGFNFVYKIEYNKYITK